MTNFEKYQDNVLAFLKNYDNLPAVVKGRPHYCAIDVCSRCDLHGRDDHCCHRGFVEWLYQEYKEIPKLTKREWFLCRALESGYVARDMDGVLCYFNGVPYKNNANLAWDISHNKGDYVEMTVFDFQSNFPFIKWEDEEPWSIEDLLKLEVEG